MTLGILAYRDFLKYLITIQEFTICLNISIIHLTEKNKVYTKAFYKNKWYIKRNKLLDENGKLRTSLKLKCNFGFENYLQILSDFNQRKFSPNLESAIIN